MKQMEQMEQVDRRDRLTDVNGYTEGTDGQMESVDRGDRWTDGMSGQMEKVSNLISKMFLLATDCHWALTAAGAMAMAAMHSFSLLSITAAISPPMTSSTLKTTIYNTHHNIHPAFSSK